MLSGIWAKCTAVAYNYTDIIDQGKGEVVAEVFNTYAGKLEKSLNRKKNNAGSKKES